MVVGSLLKQVTPHSHACLTLHLLFKSFMEQRLLFISFQVNVLFATRWFASD